MPIEKGAQLIVDDILREAKEKAGSIIQEAKKEARTILDAAQLGAKEEEEQEMKNAKIRGEEMREGILAEGRMRAKREMLQKREELINETFKKAETSLRKYCSSPRYEEDLLHMTMDAIKKLGGSRAVIQANHHDLKILEKHKDRLKREFGEVSLGEAIKVIGGVKIMAPDLKIEMDETFDGRMRREFETLRTRVAKILFEGFK